MEPGKRIPRLMEHEFKLTHYLNRAPISIRILLMRFWKNSVCRVSVSEYSLIFVARMNRTRINFFAACFIASLLIAGTAQAQFSRPVCVLKGCVLTTDQKPATVRLSIHQAGESSDNDTSSEITTCGIQEITAGSANSASGHYLLILKPDTKYWVHIEGPFVQSLDTMVSMPNTSKSLSFDQNFTVDYREASNGNPMGANADPAKKE